MPIIKGKGTFLTLIAGNFSGSFYSGATGVGGDVWVQSLSYGPKWKSELQNSFGSNDPVDVDDTYDGIKASFDVIETTSKLALSILTNQAYASAVGFDPSSYNKAYVVANFMDTKSIGTCVGSVLLKGLKVVAADTNSAVDGVQTKKFDFDGTGVIEYTKEIVVSRVQGTNSAGQVITPGHTMTAYPTGAYAQLVLVGGEPITKGVGANQYGESSTTVTLVTAVPTTSYIHVVSLK